MRDGQEVAIHVEMQWTLGNSPQESAKLAGEVIDEHVAEVLEKIAGVFEARADTAMKKGMQVRDNKPKSARLNGEAVIGAENAAEMRVIAIAIREGNAKEILK